MFIILYKKWEEDQQGATDTKRENHTPNQDTAEVSLTLRSEYMISARRRLYTTNSHAAFTWCLEKRNKLPQKLLKLLESLPTSTCKTRQERTLST